MHTHSAWPTRGLRAEATTDSAYMTFYSNHDAPDRSVLCAFADEHVEAVGRTYRRIFLDSSRAQRNTERDIRSSLTRILNAESALAVDASLSLAVRMQIGRFCVFHPGGLCRLGGLRRRGTPHAVLSPGQARRVRDRRAVDLTRLASVWDVASRRSWIQRLGYDRSANEAHASGRMPDAATQSSARNTPSRWFSSPSDVTGLVHRPMG